MTSHAQLPGIPVPESAAPDAPRPVMYRQGDVLLAPIPALPVDAVSVPRKGRIVLAEGEATGHAHAIAEPDA